MGRPAKYPIQEFNGRRYYRRPGPAGYYRTDPKFGGTYMHRDVWVFHNGPITSDDHVHHIAGAPANNAIDNLEIMHSRDHAMHHWKHDGPHSTACEAWLATIRPMAAKARQHPHVRAKLSAAAKKGAAERVPVTLQCAHCGRDYSVKWNGKNKFCSRVCKHYARKASGVDNVERICVRCGTPFLADKYIRKEHCSKSCSGRTAAETRNSL